MRTLRDLTCIGTLVLLAACKEEEPPPPSTGLTALDATPVGLTLGDGFGAGVVRLPVFATNGIGAAVPGAVVTVTAERGTLDATTPNVDALGWGQVAVTLDGSGAARVSASSPGATAEGLAFRTEVAAPTWEWAATPLAAVPTALAAAGEGLAWASDGVVWWSAAGRGTAVRVASFDLPVDGLRGVQGDNDGVTDLLVWTADTVALLRGRDDGGLAFAAGWRAAEPEIAGAAVADADSDALADILIARSDFEIGRVDVLVGDGLWGFTDRSPALTVDHPIVSISAEDMDSDGEGDVTLLTDAGVLRRYEGDAEGWIEVNAGATYDLGLGPSARLLPSADFNGDGAVDVFAYGPTADASGHQAVVVTVESRDPTKYTVFGTGIPSPTALWAAVADVSGDGFSDLVLSTPTALYTSEWESDDSGEGFRLDIHDGVPVGPVTVAELDGGVDVPDVAVASTALVVVPGTRTLDDPATVDADEGVAWRPRASEAPAVDLDLAADPLATDAGANGTVDLVGFARTGAGLVVGRWESTGSTFASAGAATVSTTGTPIDLALCGDRAWALVVETDGNVLLHAVRVWPGAPSAAFTVEVGNAGHVACGDFAEGAAAAVTADGAVTWVSAEGATSSGGSLGALADVTARDADGDGLDALATCSVDGCTVVAGDLDGNGTDELVTADGSTVAVERDGQLVLVSAAGVPTLGDADGDGVDDLLLGKDGTVTVVRGVEGGLVPGASRHLWRTVVDRVSVGDIDGDGVPDVFFPERATESSDPATVHSGRLLLVTGLAGEEG